MVFEVVSVEMLQNKLIEDGVIEAIQPSPKPLRFPVNLFKLLSNNLELIPKDAYTKPVTLSPGPPRMVFVTGEDAVRKLLQEGHETFPRSRLQNDVLSPLFEQALISLEGKDWRWQRRVVAPLFQHKELMGYCEMMQHSAQKTIKGWRTHGANQPRDISTDMFEATMRVISQTLLSGSAEGIATSLSKSHQAYFRSVNWWIVYKFLRLPRWLPRPGRAAMERHVKAFHKQVQEVVRQHHSGAADTDSLVARLMRARDPETGLSLSEDQIIDNLKGLIVGGYDTTALALAWCLYLLARFHHWEEKLYAEVNRIAGDKPVSAEHLDDLKLVRQFVSEALRMFPTAPAIVREIEQDVELEGVHVRAGTICIIPIYAIHRHQCSWAQPDKFDPTRFDENRSKKPSKYQYLPFGAGPRICIGASFAMMEMIVMIASFVQAASFKLPPGSVPEATGKMFLVSQNPIRLNVELRS